MEDTALSNRVKLGDLASLTVAQVAELPADQLALLQQEYGEENGRLKMIKEKLDAALDLKFGESAKSARAKAEKDFGVVYVDVLNGTGGVLGKVKCELDKDVKFDQIVMAKAIEVLAKEWKEDPAEYVKITAEIPEAKWKAWPAKIRDLFVGARIVKPLKPKYTILLSDAA